VLDFELELELELSSDFDVFLVLVSTLEFLLLLPLLFDFVPVLSGFKVGHGHTV
jgi:hypothetical protein